MTSQPPGPPSSSSTLSLFCWVVGDPRPYIIDICPDQYIAHLAKAIIAEDPRRFKRTRARDLMLLRAVIPETAEAMQRFKPENAEQLMHSSKIRKYFQVPEEDRIHIAIQFGEQAKYASKQNIVDHGVPPRSQKTGCAQHHVFYASECPVTAAIYDSSSTA